MKEALQLLGRQLELVFEGAIGFAIFATCLSLANWFIHLEMGTLKLVIIFVFACWVFGWILRGLFRVARLLHDMLGE